MTIQDARLILAKQGPPVVALLLAMTPACKTAAPTAEVSPATTDARAPASNASGPKLDELMSAAKLLGSYKENPHQAEALLKGKRIRVWGKINDVTRDAAGLLAVTLGMTPANEPPRARCSFAPGLASQGADLRRGADITVDCDYAGFDTDVVLNACTTPHCAMPICAALNGIGVAGDCKQATKDWSDSANFKMPSVVAATGVGGGYVECEPNDKVYYLMVNDLNGHPNANQRVFASPKARVVVSLASDEPIPAEVLAKTRSFVEGL